MIFAVLDRRLIQLQIKWLQFFISNMQYSFVLSYPVAYVIRLQLRINRTIRLLPPMHPAYCNAAM